MPTINKTQTDDLNAVLEVTITPEDYKSAFNKEVKRYSKTASFKGFRKGQVPATYIKKTVGKALLGDAIDQQVRTALGDYIEKENLELIGYPIPIPNDNIEFDVNKDLDYTFKFDVGILPPVAINYPTNHTFDYYVINDAAKLAEEDLEMSRQRMSTPEYKEESIADDDSLSVHLIELENGEPKEGGVDTHGYFKVSEVVHDDVKAQLLTSKKEDTIHIDNINDVFSGGEAFVREHLLKLKDDKADQEVSPEFNMEITVVMSLHPAELNQEFFDKVLGEGRASTKEEAQEVMTTDIESYFEGRSDRLLDKDWQEWMIENNQFDLPNAFFKKMIMESNPEATEEDIEKDLPASEDVYRWSVLRNKLAEKHNIQITRQDILNELMAYVSRQYQAPADHPMVKQMAEKIFEEQPDGVEQISRQILDFKVFKAEKDALKLHDISITSTELNEKLQELGA